MNDEQKFLQAMCADPADPHLPLVFADWLEEQGDPRAELLRLRVELTQAVAVPDRAAKEERMRQLLASGVQPCIPQMTNAIGMTFSLIPPGTFLMGSPDSDTDARDDEKPQRKITITQPFWLGVTPVTQAQYEKVMGTNPAHFTESRGGGPNHPVEGVSWDESVAFCQKLSKLAQAEWPGYVFRLPTEAEWEYACRAGTTTRYYTGDDAAALAQAGWFGGNSGYKTHPVGELAANAFGLYDMHGNVWEWCQDWYKEDSLRVGRGGYWGSLGSVCRATNRRGFDPMGWSSIVGFRLAAVPSGG